MDGQGSSGIHEGNAMTFDPDKFIEAAAWLQYCDGLNAFQAETEAARRQGMLRKEALGHAENYIGNIAGTRDQRQAGRRDSADDMPAMQPVSAEQTRPVPKRDVQG